MSWEPAGGSHPIPRQLARPDGRCPPGEGGGPLERIVRAGRQTGHPRNAISKFENVSRTLLKGWVTCVAKTCCAQERLCSMRMPVLVVPHADKQSHKRAFASLQVPVHEGFGDKGEGYGGQAR